jgi:hypothetical protein
MSGIQSYSATSSSLATNRNQVGGIPQLPKEIQSQFSSALAEAGLSDEDLAALKTDIQAVFSSAFESGSFDPSSIQSSVKDVFAKYGVDESKLHERLGPPGGFSGKPPGGKPPGGFSGLGQFNGLSSSSLTSFGLDSTGSIDDKKSNGTKTDNSADDATETLLDYLNELAKPDNNSSRSNQIDELLSRVFGFDKQA